MKFSAHRNALVEALTVTGKAIGTGILPILSSYLFKIQDDKIEITGGSMDLYIHKTIEIIPSGIFRSIAIPKSRLFDLINDSPNQEIQFEILENKDLELDKIIHSVQVTTTIGVYIIPVEIGDDYPKMLIEDPSSFNIAKDELLKAIDWTSFACSDDQLKPQLTGVFMSFFGNTIRCASTNGFLLTDKSISIDTPAPVKNGIIIPKKVLTLLSGLPIDEPVEVMVTEKNIKFKLADDVYVESILIDGRYPDYTSAIPTNLPNHLNIRKIQLSSSVKRVGRFSDQGSSQLILEISPNKLKVSTSNFLGDKADETLDLDDECQGEVRIGISCKLLMNSLAKINTGFVTISFGSPSQPLILREFTDNIEMNTTENLIMIMPMRLDD